MLVPAQPMEDSGSLPPAGSFTGVRGRSGPGGGQVGRITDPRGRGANRGLGQPAPAALCLQQALCGSWPTLTLDLKLGPSVVLFTPQPRGAGLPPKSAGLDSLKTAGVFWSLPYCHPWPVDSRGPQSDPKACPGREAGPTAASGVWGQRLCPQPYSGRISSSGPIQPSHRKPFSWPHPPRLCPQG